MIDRRAMIGMKSFWHRPAGAFGILGAGLVLALGLLIVMERRSQEPRPAPPSLGVERSAPIDITQAFVPWQPETALWKVVGDGDALGRRRLDPEGLGRAIREVRERSWALFRLAPDGFRRLDPALAESPETLRARPVEAVGELLETEEIRGEDLGRAAGLTGSFLRGVVELRRDLHGGDGFVEFLLVDPERSPGPRAGPVKIQGVYLKASEIVVAGRTVPTSFILAKRLFPSPPRPGTALDPARAPTVVDAADDRDLDLPLIDRPLVDLLAASEVGGDFASWKSHDVLATLRDPASRRGARVAWEARVLAVERLPMGVFFEQCAADEGPWPELFVVTVTADGRVLSPILFTSDPGVLPRDEVLVRAVFHKRWGYRAKAGPLWAPVFAGRSIERLHRDESVEERREATAYIALGAFAVLALAVFVYLIERRKARRSVRQERAARRRGVAP